jgi:hypothetical protein
VESGGVGWKPSSAADKPGLFSSLKSAATLAVDAGGEALPPGGAAAAFSFAFRSAAGFMSRIGSEWCPEDFWG